MEAGGIKGSRYLLFYSFMSITSRLYPLSHGLWLHYHLKHKYTFLGYKGASLETIKIIHTHVS
jgi:hypothetical protein